jgi:phosphatidylglycerophosphate synthase
MGQSKKQKQKQNQNNNPTKQAASSTAITNTYTQTMANKSTTAGDVLLYIPNLIGYLRVICTVLSLILMICFPQRWIIAIILYVSSFVGDLFDGIAARKFDQCSLFGGLLDMVTDRCSTTGLLCALSHEHAERPILVLVRTQLFSV